MDTPFTSEVAVPLLQGFWDRPAPKDVGNDPIETIYQRVGGALSWWEGVENTFALLFSVLLHAEYGISGRVYGAILSANTRRTMLETAWEVRCASRGIADEDQKLFDRLMEHYSRGGQRRNEIAHGIVTQFAPLDGADGGFFLAPAQYNTSKMELSRVAAKTQTGISRYGHKYWYTVADIEHFAAKFNELKEWTMQFIPAYALRHNT